MSPPRTGIINLAPPSCFVPPPPPNFLHTSIYLWSPLAPWCRRCLVYNCVCYSRAVCWIGVRPSRAKITIRSLNFSIRLIFFPFFSVFLSPPNEIYEAGGGGGGGRAEIPSFQRTFLPQKWQQPAPPVEILPFDARNYFLLDLSLSLSLSISLSNQIDISEI